MSGWWKDSTSQPPKLNLRQPTNAWENLRHTLSDSTAPQCDLTTEPSDDCYKQAASAYGLDWQLLKAQGIVESNNGKNTHNLSSSAAGVLQTLANLWWKDSNIRHMAWNRFNIKWGYSYPLGPTEFRTALNNNQCFSIWVGAYVLHYGGGQTKSGYMHFRCGYEFTSKCTEQNLIDYITAISDNYSQMTGRSVSI